MNHVDRRKNPWGSRSYADLITQAIQSSAEKRLTLSQIYDWLIRNVPYFSEKGESKSSAGWKNSIRHNLSLHQKFHRIPNDGKSSWWTINPAAGSGRVSRRKTSYRRRNFPRSSGIPKKAWSGRALWNANHLKQHNVSLVEALRAKSCKGRHSESITSHFGTSMLPNQSTFSSPHHLSGSYITEVARDLNEISSFQTDLSGGWESKDVFRSSSIVHDNFQTVLKELTTYNCDSINSSVRNSSNRVDNPTDLCIGLSMDFLDATKVCSNFQHAINEPFSFESDFEPSNNFEMTPERSQCIEKIIERLSSPNLEHISSEYVCNFNENQSSKLFDDRSTNVCVSRNKDPNILLTSLKEQQESNNISSDAYLKKLMQIVSHEPVKWNLESNFSNISKLNEIDKHKREADVLNLMNKKSEYLAEYSYDTLNVVSESNTKISELRQSVKLNINNNFSQIVETKGKSPDFVQGSFCSGENLLELHKNKNDMDLKVLTLGETHNLLELHKNKNDMDLKVLTLGETHNLQELHKNKNDMDLKVLTLGETHNLLELHKNKNDMDLKVLTLGETHNLQELHKNKNDMDLKVLTLGETHNLLELHKNKNDMDLKVLTLGETHNLLELHKNKNDMDLKVLTLGETHNLQKELHKNKNDMDLKVLTLGEIHNLQELHKNKNDMDLRVLTLGETHNLNSLDGNATQLIMPDHLIDDERNFLPKHLSELSNMSFDDNLNNFIENNTSVIEDYFLDCLQDDVMLDELFNYENLYNELGGNK